MTDIDLQQAIKFGYELPELEDYKECIGCGKIKFSAWDESKKKCTIILNL